MTSVSKTKGGRPSFVATDEMKNIVRMMVGVGIAQDRICAALNISDRTLRKHFARQIASGYAQLEAQLISNMVRLANGTDGTAFRANEFLLNCRFGWSRYAPAPPVREGEPEEEGKKAALERRAKDGHKETSWGDVVH